MRYFILLAIIIFIAHPAYALDASYSTFSIGAPFIATDTTVTCSTQVPVYYTFSNGAPAQVYDTTQTCTVTPPATSSGINFDEIIFF